MFLAPCTKQKKIIKKTKCKVLHNLKLLPHCSQWKYWKLINILQYFLQAAYKSPYFCCIRIFCILITSHASGLCKNNAIALTFCYMLLHYLLRTLFAWRECDTQHCFHTRRMLTFYSNLLLCLCGDGLHLSPFHSIPVFWSEYKYYSSIKWFKIFCNIF